MVADAIARSRRLLGDDVFFLTGTDEHGQKVERAAQKAGLRDARRSPTRSRPRSGRCARDLNISNDDFIRTTEPRHHRAAQEIWRRVADERRHLQGRLRGLVLHRRRDLRPRDAARRRQVPDVRQQGRAAEGGELLLPAVEVPAAAARLLSRPIPDFVQPDVPAATRCGRSSRPACRI